MGAWIEIYNVDTSMLYIIVAPYMGAWIEIQEIECDPEHCDCRSLHGSVD